MSPKAETKKTTTKTATKKTSTKSKGDKALVIVESPAKSKAIKKILGSNFQFSLVYKFRLFYNVKYIQSHEKWDYSTLK